MDKKGELDNSLVIIGLVAVVAIVALGMIFSGAIGITAAVIHEDKDEGSQGQVGQGQEGQIAGSEPRQRTVDPPADEDPGEGEGQFGEE